MLASMLLLGFLLGVRHALEADHVAAVAALATRTSSLRGLLRLAAGWGAGHSLTILVVGAILMAAGATMPIGSGEILDRLIGVVLIVMGLDVMRRAFTRRVHVHVHEHDDGERHLHLHLHDAAPAHEAAGHGHDHSMAATIRALAMGSLHGVAGSAALMLLVLPQAGSVTEAMAYLAMFGAGSIAGMLAFSLVLSFPLRIASRLAWTTAGFEGTLGAATVLIGVRILAM